MILLSEIGDKTFFIAAIMAMKNPRRWVRAYLQSLPPRCWMLPSMQLCLSRS
jgi:hypothetical protein